MSTSSESTKLDSSSESSSEKRILEPELSSSSSGDNVVVEPVKAVKAVKSTQGKRKGGKKGKGSSDVDTNCHFGTDEMQRSYSIPCPEDHLVNIRSLSKKFKMTTIKFLVSEEHERILPSDGYFPVESSMGYIIEGIPMGHNICRKCKKEYLEGSTKICRFHEYDWGTIIAEKKERQRVDGKWTNKYEKIEKEVPGWPCCESEEINAKGCQKAPTHKPSFDKKGNAIKIKDAKKPPPLREIKPTEPTPKKSTKKPAPKSKNVELESQEPATESTDETPPVKKSSSKKTEAVLETESEIVSSSVPISTTEESSS